MPGPLGRVFCLSGRGLNDAGSILDFALVAIDPADQAIDNHSDSDKDLLRDGELPKDLDPMDFVGLGDTYLYPQKPVGLGKIKKGECT